MVKKLSIIISLYSLLAIGGCFCDPALPYFDFNQMSVLVNKPLVTDSDTLSFQLKPEETRFLSQQLLQIIQPSYALALSCEHPGYEGMKYPITEIKITSTNNFDSTHLAGSSLNDLFFLDHISEFISINDSSITAHQLFNSRYATTLFLLAKPTIDSTHVFEFELIKQNGVVVEQSELVVWK